MISDYQILMRSVLYIKNIDDDLLLVKIIEC